MENSFLSAYVKNIKHPVWRVAGKVSEKCFPSMCAMGTDDINNASLNSGTFL